MKTTAVALIAVTAAACSSSKSSSSSSTPATNAPSGSTTTAATSGQAFLGCMVTDTGGIDDRSFNASSWQGMQDAKAANSNVSIKYLQSTTQADYVPNINALIQQKCGIVVTVGFLMGDQTAAAAKANPNQDFAIVDYSSSPALSNVKALIFNTAQAGFLGGYLAAGMSKTKSVATFGGQKLPTVTIYMDGFAEGVAYYNTKHNTNVKVLGWDEKSQNGTFTGDFTDQSKGKNVTTTFIQQGADIIFPVAGNVGLGAAAAAKATNGKVNLIWVDTDGCVSAPQYCSLFMTSVVKGIQPTVKTAVLSAASGSFKGGNFVGNLKNDGVGIAPFHEFASKIPTALQTELNQVRTDIIDGKITVESPSSPKS